MLRGVAVRRARRPRFAMASVIARNRLRCHLQRRDLPAMTLTAVGFEPTQLALVELESTPLDHSGKLSCPPKLSVMVPVD